MPVSLVTGGAGFIGSHVVDHLIARGHRVVVLDDLSGGSRDNLNASALFVEGSVIDHELVDALFARHGFDYVFHLAAYAAQGLSHFIKRSNYISNLIGSVNVINASVNQGTVKSFIYTSTVAVYGSNQVPMSEDAAPLPEDPYGIAKYAVELDLHEAHRMFGLPFIIFRLHNVYGERQNIEDKFRNVIGIFMSQVMSGGELTIFGDGEQTRAFTYIDDVAPIIASGCERTEAYTQVFNVGADALQSINDVARVVAKAMGVEPRIRHLEGRQEAAQEYCSHDKVKLLFGDLVKGVSLQEGVRRMAAWAKKRRPQIGQRFKDIEVRKNLPPSWAEIVRSR